MKRVNQVYTLTTSTKVDLKGVNVSNIEDGLFKKDKKAKGSQEDKFFSEAGKVSPFLLVLIGFNVEKGSEEREIRCLESCRFSYSC